MSGAADIGVSGARAGAAEVEAAAASIERGWMGMGPTVRALEETFAARLGVGFAMTDSGSNALQLAVHALRLPPGSDVVLPTFTWVACANAVVLCGHRPVFADVDAATGNADAELLARALTPRTAAVLVVHYAGRPVDVEAVRALGLPVIEDAAHAVDSEIRGRRCGAIGDVGVFSFDAVKNVATPDGGGVASADAELLSTVRRLRYCGTGASGFDRSNRGGRWWEVEEIEPFPRAIPNDVSAGIALAQLERLEENQIARRRVWDAYRRGLADVPWLALPPEPAPGERHSFFTFLVRVLDGRRDALATHLLARGIYTTLRYQPLHLVRPFTGGPPLPNADVLAEQGLNLPLHPRLSDADVDRVVDSLRDF